MAVSRTTTSPAARDQILADWGQKVFNDFGSLVNQGNTQETQIAELIAKTAIAGVRVYRSIDQPFVALEENPIVWDAFASDAQAMLGTDYITIPSTGWYVVMARIEVDAGGSFEARFVDNQGGIYSRGLTLNTGYSLIIATLQVFTQNSIVKVFFDNGSTAQNVKGSAGDKTWFAAVKISNL